MDASGGVPGWWRSVVLGFDDGRFLCLVVPESLEGVVLLVLGPAPEALTCHDGAIKELRWMDGDGWMR